MAVHKTAPVSHGAAHDSHEADVEAANENAGNELGQQEAEPGVDVVVSHLQRGVLQAQRARVDDVKPL